MDSDTGIKDVERENTSLKRTLKYISHELLNVLSIMDYSVKVLDGSKLEEKDIKYWKYIVDDVDYMIKILKELSDYNHSDEIVKSKDNLASEVELICNEMKNRYKQKIKIISYVYGEKELYNILFDRCKIRQVLVNMIKNAAEALDEKSDGVVIVCLSKEEKNIKLEIIDNGCGIAMDAKESIFIEGISINKKNGSGLGLPISKKIIESHGGTIDVVSAPDSGTIFTIRIPCSIQN